MAIFRENERAAAYYEESLEVRRRIGDLSRISVSLTNVARMALQEGETTKAAIMFAEAAEIATAIGDKRNILGALAGLGRVAYRVVWVNPHKAHDGYRPATAGMAAALPYVDDFVAGHSVAAYQHLADLLGSARIGTARIGTARSRGAAHA